MTALLAALLFPMGGSPPGLRLDVLPRENPEAAWVAFLDKLFAHFDRDSGNALSPAESARLFALPLPDGREAKPKFPEKVTREQFREAYRTAGFTPVVVVVRPAPEQSRRLGAALFHHTDRDGDGELSADELKRLPALLRRLDEDEDEVLTAAELLATAPDKAIPLAGLKLAPDRDHGPVLRLPPGGKPELVGRSDHFRLFSDRTHLSVPDGVCELLAPASDAAASLKAARGFYLAQFDALAGDKPAPKLTFADDASAQVLAELFDSADRDGDGKLTRAELEAFFDLIAAGVSCRVVVTATDGGRNLFDLLDRNGDGRLDLAELTRAARDLSGPFAGRSAVGVPATYRLTVARGTVGDVFGPVPFGTAAKPKPAAKAAGRVGPRWFRAMDRNADGFVSAAEFTGPPALFAKFDKDGDGRISVAEAEAAERPR